MVCELVETAHEYGFGPERVMVALRGCKVREMEACQKTPERISMLLETFPHRKGE